MKPDVKLPPELERVAWDLGEHPEQLENQHTRETPATIAPSAAYGLARAIELLGLDLKAADVR